MTELTAREGELEQHAKDVGAHNVHKHIQRANEKGRGAETPAGVELTQRGLLPLSAAIQSTIDDAMKGKVGPRMTAAVLMQRLPPDVLAYFTLKVGLSAAISSKGMTHAASDLGAMCEEEIRLCAFEGESPSLFRTIMRQLKERGAGAGHARRVFVFAANKAGVDLPSFTRNEKLHLGVKLLDLLIDTTGLIEVAHVRYSRKTQLRIRPTDKVGEWINNRNLVAELARPRFMPTVQQPRSWSSLSGGGYFTERLTDLPLVKRCGPAHLELLRGAKLDTVFTSINAIQNTAWCINKRILDLLSHAWDNGLETALPHREDQPPPPKPACLADAITKEAWEAADAGEKKKWKGAARRVHEHNAESRGKRVNLTMIIASAEEMRNDAAIYFPHQLDFRGRAYAVPVGLHPQGPDHARALLQFAEGDPILDNEAARWLAITGANLFGYDKANLDDRVAWVDERKELIQRTAADPFGDLWWTEADKPWCFLAWCLDWAGFLDHGVGYVSATVVSQDGSCNGLQHFSAMLRDPIGGAAVNLVPGDVPSDIYQLVADKVIERLQEIIGKPADFTIKPRVDADGVESGGMNEVMVELFATGWMQFGIDRKITKRPVMVLPYGGTFRSCLAYVREAVNKKITDGQVNPFGDELVRAQAFLAKLVWESISDVVVAARSAMDWLQKVARVAAKAGVPLSWHTPAGFITFQRYKQTRHRQVRTKLQGSIIKPKLVEEIDALDVDRQALGISPNFVHSMDAAAMMLTIEMALSLGVTKFAMIHDSYGTTAAKMPVLAKCLREAFVRMYSQHDVLQEFLHSLPEDVQAKCPPLPAMGTLGLEGILASEFFFA